MTKAKAVAKPRVYAEDRRWQARDDLRTLQQAREIQADRARVQAATREASSQIKALQTVAKVPAKKVS